MPNFNIYDENNPIIPFTSDYGFKVTFGNERNTLFLRKALQALIASPTPIKEVRFDKNTFDGITKDSRSGIYDLSCIDENDEYYIIEMQLSSYTDFSQRLKYYGFAKMNTLIRKGNFIFNNLNKIYCIAILSHSITDLPEYHTIGTIKNQNNIVIDDKIAYIIVELDKFDKIAENCISDLDKLLYTMKEAHQVIEKKQSPPFFDEDWIKTAIEDLDSRRLTPEERVAYEMTIINNAIAIQMEKEKIDRVEKETALRVEKETALRVEKETALRVEKESKNENIKLMLSTGRFSVEEIAKLYDVTIDFVDNIKKSNIV